MIRALRWLLLPFSLVYGLITASRNWMYDVGILQSVSFELPVICIGNISIGGTGKTPCTEFLVNVLKDKKIAILSRGYGRVTNGLLIANASSTAKTIGDEPLQYYNKFPNVTVAVCEDRVTGIKALQADHDVILLDDAFQHRAVKAGFNLLLFRFQSFSSFQFLLPAGNLRETMRGFRRADHILVTNTPSTAALKDKEMIQARFRTKPVTFASVKYLQPVHWITGLELPNNVAAKVILVSGIAQPAPLEHYVSESYTLLKHFNFPDHHIFTQGDMQRVRSYYASANDINVLILTTEKDIQRLRSLDSVDLPIYYIPVRMEIDPVQYTAFKEEIIKYVTGFTRNG